MLPTFVPFLRKKIRTTPLFFVLTIILFSLKFPCLSSNNPDIETFNLTSFTLEAPEEKDPFKEKFMKMLWLLGLMIGGLILTLWILKEMGRKKNNPNLENQQIEILNTVRISSKSTVHVIKWEGKKILLGESEGTLSLLNMENSNNNPPPLSAEKDD